MRPNTPYGQYPATLAHDLVHRAKKHGDRTAVAFTPGYDRWTTITYAGLAGAAGALADRLRAVRHSGSRPQFVLLMLPNSVEYVVAFYACLMAGAVAVPFYPPSVFTSRAAKAFGERLRQIWLDCEPGVIVAPGDIVDFVRGELPEHPAFIAADDLTTAPGAGLPVDRIDARPGDLALLQYTSGSTLAPRGVMVSHANLVHNTHAFASTLDSQPGESIVTWLPLYHDLGLIGTVLHPLSAGMTVHLTTPTAFIRRPFLWLDIASRVRAAIIMAPNFAYDLCVRQVTEEQRATLDLSGLRVALSGAEPVRHTTIEAFVKAYERHGLRPSAVVPGYGLAEATLAVTVSDWREEPISLEISAARLRDEGVVAEADHEPSTVLIGCGTDISDTETVIVDPHTLTQCPHGTVGEIWITGPGVAGGYWHRPELSGETFAAELPFDGRQFVRTGDLGVKVEDTLYIVGRLKDMIIQHGVKHSPQDIEHTAERAHDTVRAGGAAVFTLPGGDVETVVLVCEIASPAKADLPAIITAVRAAVAEEHGLRVDTVALVRKGQIPKTTSGKVRRAASAAQWLAGAFDTVAAWPAASTPRQEARP